jgi:hypothetical protein
MQATIDWKKDFEASLEEAKSKGKLVLLDFFNPN